MKPISSLLILLLLSLTFQSCKFDKESQKETYQTYVCPMHCEGDKTYSQKGSCPVCKMDLTPIKSTSKIQTEESISEESIFNLRSEEHTSELQSRENL